MGFGLDNFMVGETWFEYERATGEWKASPTAAVECYKCYEGQDHTLPPQELVDTGLLRPPEVEET